VRLSVLVVAFSLCALSSAAAQSRPVVVIDPGHDLHANATTEPIGRGY
jgi:hypothetical protein